MQREHEPAIQGLESISTTGILMPNGKRYRKNPVSGDIEEVFSQEIAEQDTSAMEISEEVSNVKLSFKFEGDINKLGGLLRNIGGQEPVSPIIYESAPYQDTGYYDETEVVNDTPVFQDGWRVDEKHVAAVANAQRITREALQTSTQQSQQQPKNPSPEFRVRTKKSHKPTVLGGIALTVLLLSGPTTQAVTGIPEKVDACATSGFSGLFKAPGCFIGKFGESYTYKNILKYIPEQQ